MAAVFDLFGDGRTAFKTNNSKYHRQYDADPFLVYADAGLRSENRNWFDCALNAAGTACSGVVLPTNNDGIAQDHEIGPSPSGGNFGQRSGALPGDLWRQYNLEFTAGVQHQLKPRLAVGAMFIKREIRNIQMTDRTFITLSDYTPFQVRVPAISDPAVAAVLNPSEMITVYNLKQAKNSVYSQGLVDRSSTRNRFFYTGFEASFSARLAAGGTLFGSWTAERNVSVFCESDDNPNGVTTADLYQGRLVSEGGRFCDQQQFHIPFLHEFKLAGNYPLRFGLDVGAVVHTHPPHCNAFSALRVPLQPLSHEGSWFVPPDVPRFTETSDLIITAELGRRVAETMGAQWALFLESHGIVTAGADVAAATIRALLLDKAASIQLLAAGREQVWTSDAEALRKRTRIYQAGAIASVWAYLRRRLTKPR